MVHVKGEHDRGLLQEVHGRISLTLGKVQLLQDLHQPFLPKVWRTSMSILRLDNLQRVSRLQGDGHTIDFEAYTVELSVYCGDHRLVDRRVRESSGDVSDDQDVRGRFNGCTLLA